MLRARVIPWDVLGVELIELPEELPPEYSESGSHGEVVDGEQIGEHDHHNPQLDSLVGIKFLE